MPQHLADVDQRGAFAPQLAGERVPQTVRREVLDARSATRVPNDGSHPGRLDRSRRRVLAQKHAATVVAAAQPQVCDKCFADIAGQRQTGAFMTLPVDLDLSDPPVQVVEL
ncbi:MAG TPA: hypothetical protein VH279_10470 [Solirubrobacteraceae bacterium]|nr:hypothetical protein [Solirubrobacteraceae bacterium]